MGRRSSTGDSSSAHVSGPATPGSASAHETSSLLGLDLDMLGSRPPIGIGRVLDEILCGIELLAAQPRGNRVHETCKDGDHASEDHEYEKGSDFHVVSLTRGAGRQTAEGARLEAAVR